MSSRCCAKAIATIIKVGGTEAGIIGLETALQDVYASAVKDEKQVQIDLLQRVKEFGNYITPGTESDYKDALLGEYQKFVIKMGRDAKLERSRNRS